jgi:dienelactone hydrolase
MTTKTTLRVAPDRPLLDTALDIRVTGAPARGRVTVHARQADAWGRSWASRAVFTADEAGEVALVRDAPVDGTYAGVDPMGLVWSMRLADPAPTRSGPPDPLAPSVLELSAEVGGVRVDDVTVTRRRVTDGLVRADVADGGLVGVLWRPDDGAVHPGIIHLGGAEGGLHEDDAALLAARGYAVLALAYYGLPGLPETCENVPVEYFGRALDHLAAHSYVDGDRLGIAGGSKGGEAALLVASVYPAVKTVVSVVGSGVVTQGIGQSVESGTFLEIMGTPTPNWTRDGDVLPFVPNVITPELAALVAAGAPVRLRMAFEPGLDLVDTVAAAAIPVERINGPVLLLSAGDDEGYGRRYHDVAARRLAAHGRPYRHVVAPGAGHSIVAPPYGPTTMSQAPGPGVVFEFGGSPEATAHGRAEAWRELTAFFDEHL